jgi:hypothetical protein
MKLAPVLAGALGCLVLMTAAAMADPSLPQCDSPEARAGVDFALKKSKAPFSITDYAGITTDKSSGTEIDCLAIATLSNGTHRPVGYKFRIAGGKVQSWVGLFQMKAVKQ